MDAPRWAVAALVIGLVACGPSPARPALGTLSGHVFASGCPGVQPAEGQTGCWHRPVGGARIDFQPAGGDPVTTTESAADGSYSISLPPGRYAVKLIGSEFVGQQQPRLVVVTAGRVEHVDIGTMFYGL